MKLSFRVWVSQSYAGFPFTVWPADMPPGIIFGTLTSSITREDLIGHGNTREEAVEALRELLTEHFRLLMKRDWKGIDQSTIDITI